MNPTTVALIVGIVVGLSIAGYIAIAFAVIMLTKMRVR